MVFPLLICQSVETRITYLNALWLVHFKVLQSSELANIYDIL